MVLRERQLFGTILLASALTLSALTVSGEARAEVKLEGDWPKQDPSVTLELSGVSRAEALRKLAEAGGFSIIIRETDGQKIDLSIKDQPASKVLAVLLETGSWVAKRDGQLVSISPAAPAVAPNPVAGPVAPEAAPADEAPEKVEAAAPPPSDAKASNVKPRDVEVFGNSLRIGKDEVVRDVSVMGGNVVIEGRVTGDLAVFGGNAELLPGARVEGDASVTGGRIKIQEGARIEGDLGVLGGAIEGAEKAKVGGSVKLDPEGSEKASFIQRAGRGFANGVRTAAFLFVLGAFVIALGGARAESLRGEVAARPMRSAALGIVGILGGLLGIAVAAITVIGIPVAALGVIFGVVAIFAGLTSALTVAGAAAAGHKSSNVYVHLAVGSVLFMLVGLIPIVGGLLQAGAVLAGIGAVVATRAGGLIQRRGKVETSGEPYR